MAPLHPHCLASRLRSPLCCRSPCLHTGASRWASSKDRPRDGTRFRKKQNNLRVNSLVWKFNSHFFPLRVNPFLFLRLSIFLWLSKSFHDFYIIFLLVTPLLPTKTITGLESNPSPESKYLLMACPSSDFLPMPCRHVECGFTFAASRYWMGRAPSFSNRGVKHGKASPAFHPKGSAIGAAEVCL